MIAIVSTLPNTSMAAEHPSLFFTKKDLPKIEKRTHAAPWLKNTRQHILNAADEYLKTSTTPYPLDGVKRHQFFTEVRFADSSMAQFEFTGTDTQLKE